MQPSKYAWKMLPFIWSLPQIIDVTLVKLSTIQNKYYYSYIIRMLHRWNGQTLQWF